jgi:hypothetical protein
MSACVRVCVCVCLIARVRAHRLSYSFMNSSKRMFSSHINVVRCHTFAPSIILLYYILLVAHQVLSHLSRDARQSHEAHQVPCHSIGVVIDNELNDEIQMKILLLAN